MSFRLSPKSQMKIGFWTFFSAVFVVAQVNTFPRVFGETFPDSNRYFSPTSIFSLENAGIFYSIFVRAVDDFPGITFSQILFSTFSWLLLSFSVLRLFSGWIGMLCATGTLFIALQESVTNWNNLFLSESVAISMAALWLASILLLLKPSHNRVLLTYQLSIFTLTSFLLILNRPQAIILVFPIGIALVIANRKPVGKVSASIVTFSLIAIAIGASWRLFMIAKNSPFATSYTQHLLEFRIGFTQYALQKAGCSPISNVSQNSFADIMNYCPNLEKLVAENKLSFMSWTFAQPNEALASFLKWLLSEAEYMNYSSAPTVLNGYLANQVLGVGFPFLTIVGLYVAFAVIVTFLSLILQKIGFSLTRFWFVLGFFGLLFTYVFVAWGVDGIEMSRHTLPVLIIVPLVIVGGILYTMKLDMEHEHPTKMVDVRS